MENAKKKTNKGVSLLVLYNAIFPIKKSKVHSIYSIKYIISPSFVFSDFI